MIKAVCDSNFDEIERLVKKEGFDLNGTTVDKEGKFTAQALAAYLDNLEVLHLLDMLGADMSEPKGKYQFTPLQAAESRWNVRIVDYLLERGVNPFIKDVHGFTAKDKAKLRDHKTIASMLNAYE
jgi:ankyrin repeat protein